MNKEELKNNLKSITDKFVGKENNEENRQQVLDTLRDFLEPIVTRAISKQYNTIVNEEGAVAVAVVYKYDDYDEKYLKVEFEIPLTTTCMSDEEFKRMTEAATDALTDMELKGYDIECKLRGVENVHLNNSKRNNKK